MKNITIKSLRKKQGDTAKITEDFFGKPKNETKELEEVTKSCLFSLYESESSDYIQFNVIVIESNKNVNPYKIGSTITLFPDEEFGFHKYLNIGIKNTSSDYICFCNNDLIFSKKWASQILKISKSNSKLMSFGPIDPWLHKQYNDIDLKREFIIGYEKMKHFPGWCFLVKRDIFTITGLFDENFLFWYCDDDFINTLKKCNLQHALVPKSVVKHLGSKTLGDIDGQSNLKEKLTNIQWLYIDYKWNHKSKVIYSLKLFRYYIFKLISN